MLLTFSGLHLSLCIGSKPELLSWSSAWASAGFSLVSALFLSWAEGPDAQARGRLVELHRRRSDAEREVGVVYALWFFLDVLGVHKFDLNKFGMGILYIFAGGLLLIGWLVDLFAIPAQVRKFNEQIGQ